MSKELRISKCKVLDDYKLQLTFADGLNGIVSVEHLVGKGVFEIWKDYDQFKKVSIDPISHTISWHGNIDLDPLNLRMQIDQKFLSTFPKFSI